MAIIYKITNKINGKLYIGKTEIPIEKRFREHQLDSKRVRCKDRPLYRAFSKYGIENFKIEEIEKTDTPSERERFWIHTYKTYSNGYNATLGGEGFSTLDETLIIKTLTEECENNYSLCAKKLGIDYKSVKKFAIKHGIEYTPNKERPSIRKRVKCIQTGDVFDSISSASSYLVDILGKDCSPVLYGSHISAICRGKRKSIFGYSFEYVE